MTKSLALSLLTFLLAGGLPAAGTAANVRTWAMPPEEPSSSDFKVEADGHPVFVCVAHVAPADEKLRWREMDDIPHSGEFYAVASFSSFDMSGPVKTIRVTYRDDVKQAKVLPTSYGIVTQSSSQPHHRGKRRFHFIAASVCKPAGIRRASRSRSQHNLFWPR